MSTPDPAGPPRPAGSGLVPQAGPPGPVLPDDAGPVPLVELVAIRKAYGDLVANDDISLSVQPGQVHALLGENGAGKSTLMKVLYGLTHPDAGTIRRDGRPVTIGAPADALAAGIGIVTQEFSLVGPLTVTENLLLASAGLGRLRLADGRARVLAAAQRLGVEVDPDARVDELSVGERQRVEILKAIAQDCRVLILDEPTAVLTPQDSAALFTAVRRLTADGLGVLLISHKLHEVLEVADRVSVLRRGRLTATVDLHREQVTQRRLAALMVGADEPLDAAAIGLDEAGFAGDEPSVAGDEPARRGVVLRAQGLVVGHLRVDDLVVHGGEIVGVAGVSGNGQTELVAALCGTVPVDAGTVLVDGTDVTALGVAQRFAAGLGRLSEDRRGSVVPRLSVEQNLVLDGLDRFRRGPFLDRRAVRRHAEHLIATYAIKARPTDPVGSLSGGNMQKVLLARALARDPRALVVAQPTRGLDVGACAYVHGRLRARRDAGAGVLLVSEDLDELLALSDRVVVLLGGRIAGELDAADATPQRVGLLMAGGRVAA